MLMASPEVVVEYRRHYGGIPSVIASSMAGRPVYRAADLVFIGTTSLYGQRPSQYDRIRIPRDPGAADSEPGIRYDYLGRTQGIGTFQFGDQTVAQLALLLAQSKRGQQVNSVFGEGVNPRLRKLRDGLDALGLPTDDLLNHGGPRLVYAVELIENTHDFLLGMEKQPRYLLPLKSPKQMTRQIARWWMSRWLLPPHRERRNPRTSSDAQLHPPHPPRRSRESSGRVCGVRTVRMSCMVEGSNERAFKIPLRSLPFSLPSASRVGGVGPPVRFRGW